MTESLFFSQIATKSIDAKNITNSASGKMFRESSHDFNKHLSLQDKDTSRGRSRDDISDERREPTFSKKGNRTSNRASERTERDNPAEKPQASRAERTNETKDNPGVRGEKNNRQDEQTAIDAEGKEAGASEDATKPAKSTEQGEFSAPEQIAANLGEQIAPLGETGEEELATDALVSLTEGESETLDEATPGETKDSAQVIPLFPQTTESSENKVQTITPQAAPVAQNTPLAEDIVVEGELINQTQVKEAGAAKQNPAIPALDAKQTSNGSTPGLETALGKLQDARPNTGAKPEGEVANASKNASFLGEVNIDEAQASEKTDIKARISDLAQRTNAGPVSTSVTSKPTNNLAQLANAKIDAAGQIPTTSSDVSLSNSQQSNSVHVRFGSLPQTTQSAQIPVTTIAFHIAKSVENGVNRFEIRIDPPELGRVDVRLEVGKAGRVIANLTVERPETLDLLQRDQRALERALEDAGLDVGGQSLNFSLRDQNTDTSDDAGFAADQSLTSTGAEEEIIEPEVITGYVTNSGVDIRI